MVQELTANPVFGITITLAAYAAGVKIHRKTGLDIANPIFIACIMLIFILITCNISYDSYNEGGSYIAFLLGPATVALAVPLYKNIKTIRKNLTGIFLGILCGSVTGILSAYLCAIFLGADKEIALSMAPKSVTTPIAMEVSAIIGGIPSLTVAVVVVTGIIGAMAGPQLLKAIGIKNRAAVGIAIGTASHGIGTSRAVKEGETEGAMSSFAIGAAGIITSLIAPYIINLIS